MHYLQTFTRKILMTKNQILILPVGTSETDENRCWELIWIGEICIGFKNEASFLKRRAEILEANFNVDILDYTWTSTEADNSRSKLDFRKVIYNNLISAALCYLILFMVALAATWEYWIENIVCNFEISWSQLSRSAAKIGTT